MIGVINNKSVGTNYSQLVIIGAGGAGLTAAVQASEKGITQITIFEKRRTIGGTSAMAGGIFACESPVQERQGIISNRDHSFKKAMDWAHWTNINPHILRAFINKSGETIRWLEDKGLEFDLITFYPGQMPPVQHNPRGNGAALVRMLQDECRKNKVRILRKSAVTTIMRGNGGAIVGIKYVTDGRVNTLCCGSIIIATGGFAGNSELMRRYFPNLKDGLVLSGLSLNGDGIYLAQAVGAAIEDYATLIKEGPRFHIHSWPLMAIERCPVTLWVNKRGERFTDESQGYHVFESVNSLMAQPEMVCFILLDDSIRHYFELHGHKLKTSTGVDSSSNVKEQLEKGLRDGVRNGTVKIADTWMEIAAWIGVDSHILEETVNRYNEYCKQGYDASFVKEQEYLMPIAEPPFYAIKGMAVLLDTIGGIKINEKMQVIDTEDKVIPGMYAAGVVTSGWESEVYCSELSASAFGFAINSGRIAAENAAMYLLT